MRGHCRFWIRNNGAGKPCESSSIWRQLHLLLGRFIRRRLICLAERASGRSSETLPVSRNSASICSNCRRALGPANAIGTPHPMSSYTYLPVKSSSLPTTVRNCCAPETQRDSRPETRTAICLKNRSQGEALVLEIGTCVADDTAFYSDIDMVCPADGKPAVYTHRDGTPYEGIKRRGPEE